MSHTIAAVSTGNAVSAIGIIRMTGDDCIAVADQVFTLNNKKPLTTAPDRKLLLGELRQLARADRLLRPYHIRKPSLNGSQFILTHGAFSFRSTICRLIFILQHVDHAVKRVFAKFFQCFLFIYHILSF